MNSGLPGYPFHSNCLSIQFHDSGIALCLSHKFQKTKWALIADSTSPPSTWTPGKKADNESIVEGIEV